MEKFDLVKPHKSYFSAKPVPALIEIEKASFISISGKGDPSGVDFAENIGALYATAYSIKFACKASKEDFTVSKLESSVGLTRGNLDNHLFLKRRRKFPEVNGNTAC